MTGFYRIFLVLTLFLFQSAFAVQPITSDASSQKTIFNEINAFRVKQGLSPLIMNNAISAEAAEHSREMAENVVPFGHDGFRGRVHTLFEEFKKPRGAAENVAFIYKDTNAVVDMWLNSSGHRRNIEGNFNLTGIGIAHGQHGRVYVTQIFLRAM